VIRTRGLTRRFGDLVAVDRLDLEVDRGEVLGFLGPNGAGKTTTVRMLCCLIAPTAGEAVVNGFDIHKQPDRVRRSVGILTESPGMYERLSAAQNLEIFAALYEVDDIAGQVAKYLKLLGLWDRRHDPVAEFSKGMKQKLAICRALLHEPDLIFLDEPTSGLDPEAARLVRDFIDELSGEGRTFFLCTHNLEEADRLCDRIALFKSRLLVVDTAANLREAMYGRQVVITLSEATDEHVRLVRALPFSPEVVRKDGQLLVRTQDPEADNPQIVRALVGAGADVRFVSEVRHSLEQVYLELLEGASP